MKGCRPLQQDEVGKVIAALQTDRDRTLFVLGCTTGLRISELLSVRVRHIYPGEWSGVVEVKRRHMKGAGEGRVLPLHPMVRKHGERHVKRTYKRFGPDAFLFGSKRRRTGDSALAVRSAQLILSEAYQVAGVTGAVGTHSMRKFFASQVHERLGRDINRTKEALGHRWIQTTVAYLSFDRAEIDSAVTGIDW
ncbi:MAG: tyrosine-type recombinase/integrase [Deltaproteobacteria bacterium]|nr:tyrosine-type recombinase/integrase [Deltaproteobacteria bacterium]